MIPVTGDLIEISLGEIRSLSKKTALRLFHILYPSLQELDNTGALRQKDRKTLTDIIHSGEILKFTSKLVMITLQRFLTSGHERLQLFLIRERCTIDTLEHLILL